MKRASAVLPVGEGDVPASVGQRMRVEEGNPGARGARAAGTDTLTKSEYGLSDKTVELVRKVLEDYPAVEKAVLYGSRTKGTYRHGSDMI